MTTLLSSRPCMLLTGVRTLYPYVDFPKGQVRAAFGIVVEHPLRFATHALWGGHLLFSASCWDASSPLACLSSCAGCPIYWMHVFCSNGQTNLDWQGLQNLCPQIPSDHRRLSSNHCCSLQSLCWEIPHYMCNRGRFSFFPAGSRLKRSGLGKSHSVKMAEGYNSNDALARNKATQRHNSVFRCLAESVTTVVISSTSCTKTRSVAQKEVFQKAKLTSAPRPARASARCPCLLALCMPSCHMHAFSCSVCMTPHHTHASLPDTCLPLLVPFLSNPWFLKTCIAPLLLHLDPHLPNMPSPSLSAILFTVCPPRSVIAPLPRPSFLSLPLPLCYRDSPPAL